MANTRMKRVAREARSQETKTIRNEAVRIDTRLKIMLDIERIELRQVLEVASPNLQDFIFEKILFGIEGVEGNFLNFREDSEK